MSRKTSLKNRLAMYDNLQQQVNYLPELLTGQFGIPFMEDLFIQNQNETGCCVGFDPDLDNSTQNSSGDEGQGPTLDSH